MKTKRTKEEKGDVEKLKAQLVRALADYDNLKKRVEREQSESGQRALGLVIARLLPVFDMFEQAQAHVNDAGLAMALGELGSILDEFGVSAIEPKKGDGFDEETMEVVEVVEEDGMKAGQVAELGLKGYRMGDRILRYAKVVVCGDKLALDSRE